MQSIAINSAALANLFKNYSVQKDGVFFHNCTKTSLIVLCWKSQQSKSGTCIKIQKKENKVSYIATYLEYLANEKKWAGGPHFYKYT